MIRFEVSTSGSFDGLEDEIMDHIANELRALRCPTHGEGPDVKRTSDGLDVGACCEELMRLVNECTSEGT